MPNLRFPKPYADFVARLRAPGGFLLVAAFLWLSDPTPLSLGYGLPVSVLGLLLRGWAAGHVTKDQRLTTSGPYAFVRNPLYLGTLIVAAGVVLASRQLLLAGLFTAVFILVYLPAIELEEQHLADLFPEFGAYAARVPMLWPRLRSEPAAGRTPPSGQSRQQFAKPTRGSACGPGGPPHFTWRLYRHNREYQALAGFLAGVLVLMWKAWR
jgi:protein-S-isoprenylcysteine O-methyltransferase Ste14